MFFFFFFNFSLLSQTKQEIKNVWQIKSSEKTSAVAALHKNRSKDLTKSFSVVLEQKNKCLLKQVEAPRGASMIHWYSLLI